MEFTAVTNPTIRLRVDFARLCCVGPGKIALLEAIHRTGSLSQAARDLGMSYRRGWQLLASLNDSFDDPIVVTATGGRGGGGARVTSFGRKLIGRYRAFEDDAQLRAARTFKEIADRARAGKRPAGAAGVARLSGRMRTARVKVRLRAVLNSAKQRT
ncbi:MAG: LysR family transcriptional regulator [Gammaproteobacteria bacterium]|nr:LysR family transcriptional regulator [Gammaproteobacteria bacterium]